MDEPGSNADAGLTVETTTYLQMSSVADLRPSKHGRTELDLRRAGADEFALGRQLYESVGRDWLWIDRLSWSEAQWRDWYAKPGVELWVASREGTLAGYFELHRDQADDTEIAYFGLLPAFIGHGLGGQLLTAAARRAWEGGARRVWVHTSSRDHGRALANYLARGFHVYHTETRPTPDPRL